MAVVVLVELELDELRNEEKNESASSSAFTDDFLPPSPLPPPTVAVDMDEIELDESFDRVRVSSVAVEVDPPLVPPSFESDAEKRLFMADVVEANDAVAAAEIAAEAVAAVVCC